TASGFAPGYIPPPTQSTDSPNDTSASWAKLFGLLGIVHAATETENLLGNAAVEIPEGAKNVLDLAAVLEVTAGVVTLYNEPTDENQAKLIETSAAVVAAEVAGPGAIPFQLVNSLNEKEESLRKAGLEAQKQELLTEAQFRPTLPVGLPPVAYDSTQLVMP